MKMKLYVMSVLDEMTKDKTTLKFYTNK